MYHGVIAVNKPSGPSSHDMVYRLRKVLQMQKIGHTGTLDPFASGVLVMGIGQGTKILEYLQHQRKTYVMVLRLGLVTDTFDCNGQIIEQNVVVFSLREIEQAVYSFIGGYDQVPPVYSAKKLDGKRLYDLARKGKIIRMPPKRVEIDSIEILEVSGADIRIRVVAGEGTYMRSLAMDIGYTLGTGATAMSLIRVRNGSFCVEEALSIQENTTQEQVKPYMKSVTEALPEYKKLYVTDECVDEIRNGKQIYTPIPYSYKSGQLSDMGFSKDELLLVCSPLGIPVAVVRAEVNGSFAKNLAEKHEKRRIATLVKVFGAM
jgi:tRNA pseudouridine55 synthase